MKKRSGLFTTGFSLLLYCASFGPVAAQLDEATLRPLLQQLAAEVIIPAYETLHQHAQTLEQASRDFCGQPDTAKLHNVRDSWSATLSSWQQAGPLLFGPATENGIDFAIYFIPVKKAVVKAMLAKAAANPNAILTPDIIAQVGAGGQGLATLEYLLFDRTQSEAQLLALFQGGHAGQQRCAYLVSASELVALNIRTIQAQWRREEGPYTKAFVMAGQDTTQFTETYQPLELLINRLVQALEVVEGSKLAGPLGLDAGSVDQQTVYPYKLEAWRSGHSWKNITASLQGVQNVLDAGGVLAVLRARGEIDLANQLDQELQILLATTLDSDDLFQVLEAQADRVKQFYEQLRVYTNRIRNELAPTLGVKLGFNSNDGD